MVNSSDFVSTAKIEKIYGYKPQRYDVENKTFNNLEDFYTHTFPSIIKSDGKVWDLASIYFHDLLMNQYRDTSTVLRIANDLLSYLRFIENKSLTIDNFPLDKQERPTYLYHLHLRQQFAFKPSSQSTASQKMRHVLRFYDFCIEKKLFSPEHIKP
ncbi:MAG: hypothetical protein GAK29_02365 [Acinetobacter bereziniae]|uniref:Core-binding (CB) domain-containing protein n=1 Tax=Acinetobacter bereziniae TaxID=106648 RepID=A0A833PFW8_ACIBZ|nr:MAG: hypothetical protein GAK29_02365 [Acinetobacter bereziniae]